MHVFHTWGKWKPSTARGPDGNQYWQYRTCEKCGKKKVINL